MHKFQTTVDPVAATAVRQALGTSAAPYVRLVDAAEGDGGDVVCEVWSDLFGRLRRNHRLVVKEVASDHYQVWLERKRWSGFRPVRCVNNPFDLNGFLV
jgi:hypothetical protein